VIFSIKNREIDGLSFQQFKCNSENLDIVVVLPGDEGELKRFSKMGDNIILLAEIPKYDPILLSDDHVNILGIAVCMMKSGSRN
jgi:SOS-response transcriptional repressor LexA